MAAQSTTTPHNAVQQSPEVSQYANMPESQYFDRKSARIKPEDMARHIIALANAAGGKLAIGIEDDGTVTGFKRSGAKPIEQFEQAALTQCKPTPWVTPKKLSCTNANGDDDIVLLLDVAPSPDHIIEKRVGGDIFLREGDSSVKLDRSQIQALEYDKGQMYFEDEPVRQAGPDELDHAVLDEFKCNISAEKVGDKQVLQAQHFLDLDSGKLTAAGVLLFTKSPMKYFPGAWVRVLRVDGTTMQTGERFNITKDEEFTGPLVTQIRQASQLIEALLRDFYPLNAEGRFAKIPEYPHFSWFEGLINAVAHRDYSIQGDYIRVTIFDDRLEISSPGTLPNRVTLENMRTTRHARNPRICHMLNSVELTRELNEGVHRIYEEMEVLGLPDPEYSEPSGMVTKMVLRNNVANRIPYMRGADESKQAKDNSAAAEREQPALNLELSETERLAVNIAKRDGRVTPSSLTSEGNISKRTARRTLSKLTESKILQRHGQNPRDPNTYYSE